MERVSCFFLNALINDICLCDSSLQSPCSSFPCKNGATCVPNYDDDTFHCICKKGFSSKLCRNGTYRRSFVFFCCLLCRCYFSFNMEFRCETYVYRKNHFILWVISLGYILFYDLKRIFDYGILLCDLASAKPNHIQMILVVHLCDGFWLF